MSIELLGLMILLMSFIWELSQGSFQTVSEYAPMFLLVGISALGIVLDLDDETLPEIIVPSSKYIPDTELSPLATQMLIVLVSAGAIAFLLISTYLYVGV
ncbi:hypothetical protein [Haloquadratum walsbyi]|jgi:hypothetical protein|uniref:Uncharacterized protein n=1 Tax=Haloquadratum walsbyi J07HQW2 TaxID=1238425 RepID=U1PNW2_9EURY|nr:hypothetical protein [Haloquadratum walsbyi]ERG93961.1 MAG: hypothetical protein J07HQW2_00395 [Haloquadratum walsbyi J07HQW2]